MIAVREEPNLHLQFHHLDVPMECRHPGISCSRGVKEFSGDRQSSTEPREHSTAICREKRRPRCVVETKSTKELKVEPPAMVELAQVGPSLVPFGLVWPTGPVWARWARLVQV